MPHGVVWLDVALCLTYDTKHALGRGRVRRGGIRAAGVTGSPLGVSDDVCVKSCSDCQFAWGSFWKERDGSWGAV